jgi:mannitol-specific phosphotransferase system IIBC component
LKPLVLQEIDMLISMIVAVVISLVLGVLYFKTLNDIKRDDIQDAMDRAQRLKNKRNHKDLVGA